jgi:hypothetical protein
VSLTWSKLPPTAQGYTIGVYLAGEDVNKVGCIPELLNQVHVDAAVDGLPVCCRLPQSSTCRLAVARRLATLPLFSS